MTERPERYDPQAGLEARRRHMISVLHAGADWLSSITDEKLPLVLKRLEPLVDELERSASPVQREG